MLFIVNPKSGKGQIRPYLLDILDVFAKAGFQVQVHVTQGSMDAKVIAEQTGEAYDLIVCSGGDGTLNETISGMAAMEHRPRLGYIPAGSTNDFATSCRIPKNMVQAAQAVVEGEPYLIDIGRFCQERYFVYLAGFGAFTEVSYLTPQEKKNLLGHQAYMLEGMKSLTSLKSYKMKVKCREAELEGQFIFGIITNTISVGGFKGLVGQDVALNDGLFEVLLIRTPRKTAELREVAAGLILKDDMNPLVHKFKTSQLEIESEEPVDWVLDGEFGGSRTSVWLENLHQQIEICRVS